MSTQEPQAAPAAKTTMLGIDTSHSAPLAAPAAGTENQPAGNSWHWCPDCYIAAGKPGACPSCNGELEPAPPEGLPYGPYQPRQVKRHSHAERVVALIGILAMLALLGVGGLLFHLGSAPAVASSSDGLVNSNTNTKIQFPTLGSASIPGVWTTDDTLKTNLDTSLNASGGQASVLLAERSSESVLWMASITKSPGGSGGSDGCSTSPISNQSPVLAGHPAELDYFKLACPGDVEYVVQYTMQINGTTLMLRVMSPASNAPFQRIENALLQIPGSSGGGVAL